MSKGDLNARKWLVELEYAGYAVHWDKSMDAYIVERDGVYVMGISDVAMRYAKFDIVDWAHRHARERGVLL